jgi:aspartyl-tRNA synthetase
VNQGIKGMKRSCYCGELKTAHVGQEVTLMGWVHRRRDHGGIIFVDLRDREGLVQVAFNPEICPEYFAQAEAIRNEHVIAVTGKVSQRPDGTINPNLKTGHVEVYATELRVLNKAKTPPFYIEDGVDVDEVIRLKYRYLDLRRPEMKDCLILRHKIMAALRHHLDQEGFLEIETPMLTKSTPEGARDYLVPSRVHPGEFYALPQSPQLFKQLLMVAGMDKYFQIARCFRDEDLRADRQPEFTQLDIEMSFVEIEDVLSATEAMIKEVFLRAAEQKVTIPFPRLTYQEAMDRFGSDKPDLRFGMELIDLADIALKSDFKVFASVAKKGGWVRGLNAKGCGAKYSRKDMDDLTAYVAVYGAKGLAYMMIEEDGKVKSPIAKFFTEEQLKAICERMEAAPGDLLMFGAAERQIVADSLGHLRQEIARRENLINPKELNFLWVTDFPLLAYDDEEDRYTAVHHPFTSPNEDDLPLLESEPLKVRANAYDLILNGTELGGGSIRIHDPQVQKRMFALLGMSEAEYTEKFDFLLQAFEYGTPPHGGIAFGLDRMIMLLANRESIRDVIAFPKTQSAACLLTDAPNQVDDKQLKELSIKTNIPAKINP